GASVELRTRALRDALQIWAGRTSKMRVPGVGRKHQAPSDPLVTCGVHRASENETLGLLFCPATDLVARSRSSARTKRCTWWTWRSRAWRARDWPRVFTVVQDPS